MKFNALAQLERNVHRAGEIIAVLANYGLADWVKGLKFSWIQDWLKSIRWGQPLEMPTKGAFPRANPIEG